MFQLEANIPAPPVNRRFTYPFNSMEVGIAFFVPAGKKDTIKSATYNYTKRCAEKGYAVEFVTWDAIRDGVEGVWCKRVA